MDQRKKIIAAITTLLLLAGLFRLAGISYGLPLQLIADEPQFIMTALGMAQAKMFLIPSQEAYQKLLYNPPYIVYLFLFPFFILASLVGISDITPYAFILARLLSITFSILSILFLYKVAYRLFPEQGKKTALCAAYFLATSLLAIAISATARHWSFALSLIIGALAILTAASWKTSIRYGAVFALAGIAVGINQAASVFILLIAALWYIIMEKKDARKIFSERWFWGGVFLLTFFSVFSFVLYPNSLYGVQQESWGFRSVSETFTFPVDFIKPLIQSEPILMILATLGLYALWREKRKVFWVLAFSVIGYVLLFYFLYGFQHRHLSLLLPFFALLAAYGTIFLWRRIPKPWNTFTVIALLAVPLIVGTRFSFLLWHNDSRVQAREWFENHIPEGTRVITRAYLMRLSMTPASVREKRVLAGTELSADEYNEYMYPNYSWGRRTFHALNTAIIKNKNVWYDGLTNYACAHGYEYVIAQDTMLTDSSEGTRVAKLLDGAEKLVSFGSADERYSVTDTRFNASPWTLSRLSAFGPQIRIYRINRETLCRGIATLPPEPPIQTLFQEKASLKKGEFNAYPFALTRDTFLHININIFKNERATALLMTEKEFRSLSNNQKTNAITRITEGATVIQLSPGNYVFVIGSETDNPTYTVNIMAE